MMMPASEAVCLMLWAYLCPMVLGDTFFEGREHTCYESLSQTLSDHSAERTPETTTLAWCEGTCRVYDETREYRIRRMNDDLVRCYCQLSVLGVVDEEKCNKDCGVGDSLMCGGNEVDVAGNRIYVSSYHDFSECANKSDSCEQICVNTMGSYRCICHDGYYLMPEGMTCHDIDECLEDMGGCEHNCTNLPGNYRCSCDKGFILGHDNKSCSDVNECMDGTHSCQHRCQNIPGGYICSCHAGYRLNEDETTCTDIDECVERDPCQHTCQNVGGTFLCLCDDGYTLSHNGINCTSDRCRFAVFSHGDRQSISECHLIKTLENVDMVTCAYTACSSGGNLINYNPADNRRCEVRMCYNGDLKLTNQPSPAWLMFASVDIPPDRSPDPLPLEVWLVIAILAAIAILLVLTRVIRCSEISRI